jgi:translation initiation factor IF-3
MAGIFELSRAIFFAKEHGCDLALVSENTTPPVAKLVDYGKLQYRKEKMAQKQKKQKHGQKEIRVSLKISPHDLEIKTKRASQFLTEGYKVKINLRLMGREMQFRSKAYDVLNSVIDGLSDVSDVETPPFQERNQFNCQLTQKKKGIKNETEKS